MTRPSVVLHTNKTIQQFMEKDKGQLLFKEDKETPYKNNKQCFSSKSLVSESSFGGTRVFLNSLSREDNDILVPNGL